MKSGFIAIVGRPNVGKSTLLNRLIETKLSIVSDKPQTTRNRILGIRTAPDAQIVFLDTPGIHRPGYRLNERMMEAVYSSIRDVDLLLHMIDASEKYGKGEEYALEMIRDAGKKSILVLNKVDLINKGRLLPVMEFYSQQGVYTEIVPVSALHGTNTGLLTERIIQHLPEGEQMFPEDTITDRNERFLVGEIIREKVLGLTRQELPYSTAVQMEEFDESRREEDFVRITASIIVDKPTQKKIVIGRAGRMIKQIGTEARREIESLLDVEKVYLDLNVKVVPGWRNREHLLDELGVI